MGDHHLTDLAFTHIPKNAGDAVANAFSTIGVDINGFVDGQRKQCHFSQLPPQKLAIANPDLARRRFGGKEVFCVVRDPYGKAISAACMIIHYRHLIQPTAALVNMNLKDSLARFRSGHYTFETCFFAPQVDYMKGPYGCKHALDFRHLERDFNNFTKTHGYNLPLPHPNETHFISPYICKVTKDD